MWYTSRAWRPAQDRLPSAGYELPRVGRRAWAPRPGTRGLSAQGQHASGETRAHHRPFFGGVTITASHCAFHPRSPPTSTIFHPSHSHHRPLTSSRRVRSQEHPWASVAAQQTTLSSRPCTTKVWSTRTGLFPFLRDRNHYSPLRSRLPF